MSSVSGVNWACISSIFSIPTPCSPVIDPPTADTVGQDVLACFLRLMQITRFTRIKEDNRVHVAVAGVEDIADGQTVLLANLADIAESRRDLGTGHDTILHVVKRADPADGAKRVLAALPQKIALFGRSRHTEVRSAAGEARIPDLFDLLLDSLPQTFQLDQ